jgi:hypothetical protein
MSRNGAAFDGGDSTNAHVITSVSGRYSLADLRNAHGERRVFHCRAASLSPHTAMLAAPVKGKIGERVIAHMDRVGKIEGTIERLLEHGFVLSIMASKDERDRLAAKIEWLENHKNQDVPDRRIGGPRTIPANPNSKIVLADGRVESCLVLDLSVSGAAVSADTVPDIGAVLAVGSVVGRVVRHFVDGFGVQFVQRQHQENVETMVILA